MSWHVLVLCAGYKAGTEKPEVLASAKEQAAEILLNIHLAELRERMGMTQKDIAAALNVKQPTISDMEKPGSDLKLLSLPC